ncbi:restriction endonuclease subunit S [Burkholderia seminalis]|uniref:restriction endonuclease subunit S n=1 Tax=Burkholderia seminalis TaxID=488731 RepID=UPI000A75A7F3|nr:restriction endonuclease subunit S [Burkholderia seminalis]
MSVAPEMKNQLPRGWSWVSIGETGQYINGFAFKPSHREPIGLPIVRIQNLTDESKPLNTTTLDVPNDYKIDSGSMLVSWSATLDVFVWHRGPALVNQHIFKVVPDERLILKELLFHWLGQAIQQLQDTEHLHGSTMMHINRGPFMAHLVPLPPRSEQSRIVAKLEELLSDLDAGVAELKTAQKKLQQYRQSLLKAAVEGALTGPWREAQRKRGAPAETGAQLLQRILTERRARWETKQLAKFKEQGKAPPKDWQKKYPEPVQPNTTDLPVLPEGWVWATIDQLTIEQRYGSSAKTSEDNSGVPVLRMGNIQDGRLDYTSLKYLPKSHEEFPALFLEDGDLLFNRTNSPELVGKTAVYRSECTPCSYASYLIAVRFSKDFAPELASAWINSAHGRYWIKSVAVQQTGQANVNGSKLAAFVVPVPPADEQIELMRALSEQTNNAVEQEKSIAESLKQSTAQRNNILRAAFAGLLVQQDPDDEPSSALLERVRAEREERAKQPKARKTKQQKEITAVLSQLIDVLADAGDWVPAQEVFRRCGVADGALTDQIEALYAELRALDKVGRLAIEPVVDAQGRKLYDKLKLLAG